MTSSPQMEMRSSGPWPETEISTASGDAATERYGVFLALVGAGILGGGRSVCL